MDELQKINRIELRGTLADRPHYSHENRDERFFVFPISIPRLSGAVDRINVLAREEQLKNMEICELPKIYVSGELRSFNNKSGEGSRLVITVFARELRFDEGESLNSVWLTGTICKPPNLRTTPMGGRYATLCWLSTESTALGLSPMYRLGPSGKRGSFMARRHQY
jgi:hypothetical protein